VTDSFCNRDLYSVSVRAEGVVNTPDKR